MLYELIYVYHVNNESPNEHRLLFLITNDNDENNTNNNNNDNSN